MYRIAPSLRPGFVVPLRIVSALLPAQGEPAPARSSSPRRRAPTPNASPPREKESKGGKGCVSLPCGCGAFLALLAVVAGILFATDTLPEVLDLLQEELGIGGDPPRSADTGYTSPSGGGASVVDWSGVDDPEDEDYGRRRTASGDTEPEYAEAVTSSAVTTISLSDGTRLDLPASSSPVPVRLSRQSNAIALEHPGLETSGSMRVLEFDPNTVDGSFIPVLTIPGCEFGELDLATVNIARVGPRWVDGMLIDNDLTYLSATRTADGDIQVVDTTMAALAAAWGSLYEASAKAVPGLAAQYGDGKFNTVRYVPMSFQGHLEWYVHPRIVRMIPDPDAPGLRRPAVAAADKEILEQPVSNIVVLVHGHNEEEWDGSAPPSTDYPWDYAYKQEVWTALYRAFLETQADRADCTAFYEFIYPTFRPAYSPLESGVVEPLGTTLAKALRVGAKNDAYLIRRLREAKMDVNLYVGAHSMGGLVAREGLRSLDSDVAGWFRQLVTWGTPHHGSSLVSMGYLFRGAYVVNAGRLREAHWFPSWVSETDVSNLLGTRLCEWILDQGVQLDTPGTRDLRWDNYRSLRLDEIFSEDTKVLAMLDPANVFYDLRQGAFLYNGNLRQMNESDPYHGESKYTFIYGTTGKRLPDSSEQTAVGATLIPFLLKNPDRVAGDFVGHADGLSDGAVPVASMAGVGLGGATIHVGDVDHEEYYGAAYGRATAMATFTAWGIGEARCECPEILIERPADSSVVEAGDALEIVAWYALDPALDPEPGRRIEGAEAFLEILGQGGAEYLGTLDVSARGELTGSFRMPDLGEGEHLLVVRANLKDGTHLESDGNWVGAGERVIPIICPDGRPPGPDGCDYSWIPEGD